jgi:hypothetical protein
MPVPSRQRRTSAAKKAAFIAVHGMGSTRPGFDRELVAELRRRLGARASALHVGKVYYQGILQPNEQRVWGRVRRRVRWDALRKFLLYGFADAAGLESAKTARTSVYAQAQALIARQLFVAWQAMAGEGPVVILAQSLGGHVVSCYFWDAQQARQGARVAVGIWQDIRHFERQITGGNPLTPAAKAFLQGKSFRAFYTTGCNIPIFVAAHASAEILPITPNATFEWHNFYDRDDVLGWPLADLSPQYAKVVQDHPINAGGGIVDWLAKSWNPLSHGQYWRDADVLDPLEAHLRALLA